MLLTMGLATQMLGWHEEFCEALADRGFHVIRFDNRDVGRSSWIDAPVPGRAAMLFGLRRGLAYTLGDMADDAAGLLDALGLDSAHVVGASMGGMIAQTMAIEHADRVRSLTAVSVPHPAAYTVAYRVDPEQKERSAYIRLFWQAGKAEEVLLADDARRLRRMLHGDGDTGVPAEAVDEYVSVLSAPGALTAALNWYRAMSSDVRVEEVDVPTTYVWSDGDVAIGRTAAEACANYVTGDYRFVELPGVTHWIPEHAPEQLSAAILDRIAAS